MGQQQCSKKIRFFHIQYFESTVCDVVPEGVLPERDTGAGADGGTPSEQKKAEA